MAKSDSHIELRISSHTYSLILWFMCLQLLTGLISVRCAWSDGCVFLYISIELAHMFVGFGAQQS